MGVFLVSSEKDKTCAYWNNEGEPSVNATSSPLSVRRSSLGQRMRENAITCIWLNLTDPHPAHGLLPFSSSFSSPYHCHCSWVYPYIHRHPLTFMSFFPRYRSTSFTEKQSVKVDMKQIKHAFTYLIIREKPKMGGKCTGFQSFLNLHPCTSLSSLPLRPMDICIRLAKCDPSPPCCFDHHRHSGK